MQKKAEEGQTAKNALKREQLRQKGMAPKRGEANNVKLDAKAGGEKKKGCAC